jgi:hypothetical protein
MIEAVMASHRIVNSPENYDFKQKNALEQHLISMRNEFLTHSVSSNSVIMNAMQTFRSAIIANEDSAQVGRALGDITSNIQNDWNKNQINPAHSETNLPICSELWTLMQLRFLESCPEKLTKPSRTPIST